MSATARLVFEPPTIGSQFCCGLDRRGMWLQACYRVREVAKSLWEPIEERDKDYIAAAKPNGYRSLHSTLRVPSLTVEVRPGDEDRPTFDAGLGGGQSSPEGMLPLELQIRTKRESSQMLS